MKNLSKVDASGLIGSGKKDDSSRLTRFSTKSTTPVLASPARTEDACGSDESRQHESSAELGHHWYSKRASSRFQSDQFPHRSLLHPFRARSSLGINSTAAGPFASRSPSSPSPSPSESRLDSALRHRSVSPAIYTSLPSCYPPSRPELCSHSPSHPPPMCPLPSPPADQPSPSSFQSTLSGSSSPASPPLSGLRAGRFFPTPVPQPFLPRLQPLSPLRHFYPGTSHCESLGHLEYDYDDDDPFAAEQLVVSRPPNRSRPAWSDEESVDPLGPLPHPSSSRPASVYTSASGSCYSINTTIERFSQVSINVAAYANAPQLDEPLHSISMSEDSQEGPSTPSIYSEDEQLSQSSIPPLRRMPLPSPEASPSKCFSAIPSPSPVVETFSFGLPSRFDGLFFGYHKRPDSKYHAGPAIVLEVSPPVSSTSFSPGDSIRFKICLASVFDNMLVSFVGESRYLGERKLKSHQFLKHEVDLDRPGQWGCWTIQRGPSSKEWFVELKIPGLSNCDCGQKLGKSNSEGMNLPSSTINSQVFISYHLIIRGIGKQKKNEKTAKPKKKSKGEENVRLTVTIKNKLSPNSQPGREQIEAGHSHSCFSIERF